MSLLHETSPSRPRLGDLTLEAVFRAHFDDVYRMVARLLGPGASSADVDDVVSLVFIAVQKALPKFRGDAQLTTWLYGISSRVVLRQLRSWRRHRRLLERLQGEPTDVTLRATPEQTASQRQELIDVWKCLMKVSPKKRVVFVMFEIEEMTGKEIADTLGIPEATVWTRLHHARKDLKRSVERQKRREAF